MIMYHLVIIPFSLDNKSYFIGNSISVKLVQSNNLEDKVTKRVFDLSLFDI